MKSHIQIRYQIWQEEQKYFKNYLHYARKIKKVAQELLPKAKVIVFGSIVRGEYGPNSDIDILIVSDNLDKNWEKRREIRTKIKSQLPFLAPFQIHLATKKEFQNWYKKFIKQDYKRI